MARQIPASWAAIAREDQRLREAADNASEALARLRWENTLAVGTSFMEYARNTGVSSSTVSTYARAHVIISDDDTVSIGEALARASMSTEKAAVVEAIAEERGVAPKTVQAHGGQAVRRVRQLAEDRAERRGTSVVQEASAAARSYETMRRAEKHRAEAKASNASIRFLTIDQDLDRARNALIHALNESHGVEWDEESRDLIVDALNKIRAVIGLLDARFTGMTDVDWDAELLALGEA